MQVYVLPLKTQRYFTYKDLSYLPRPSYLSFLGHVSVSSPVYVVKIPLQK